MYQKLEARLKIGVEENVESIPADMFYQREKMFPGILQ